MIRVVVADDHAVVRRGLADILSDHADLELAGEASDYPELLSLVTAGVGDVVVFDIRMPGGNVLDFIKRAQTKRPTLPLLVLSGRPEDQFALRLIRAGASGYIAKEAAPVELVGAIRQVSRGRRHVSPGLALSLVDVLAGDAGEAPHTQLSDREFQVLTLLASGKSATEIGAELYLSVKTISTYRSRILKKMGLKSNAEIVRYAFEHGLVE